MSRKTILISVALAAGIGLACIPAGAEDIVISTPGATPFLYAGTTYMPVKSVASFLGADLGWDPNKGQAVITYQGQQFSLTPGKTNAMFGGQPVVLTAPPVVINGRTYVSTEAFKKYYKVPMQWDPTTSQVRILGPDGWGTTTVKNRAPWHGGPPPWAPAWGQRSKNVSGVGSVRNKPGQGAAKRKSKGQAKPKAKSPGYGNY